MAQTFKETAHLKTDQKAYEEGWERIFGKKKEEIKEEEEQNTEKDEENE